MSVGLFLNQQFIVISSWHRVGQMISIVDYGGGTDHLFVKEF